MGLCYMTDARVRGEVAADKHDCCFMIFLLGEDTDILACGAACFGVIYFALRRRACHFCRCRRKAPQEAIKWA